MVKVIRIDDDVWEELQKRAKPFVDTPNSVLRRVLKFDTGGRVERRRPRVPGRTRQGVYRQPILEALKEMGGRASRSEILKSVYDKMRSRLNSVDVKTLPVSPEPRWRKTADYERLEMVHEGLLRDDSPKGIWELTEEGWKQTRQGS